MPQIGLACVGSSARSPTYQALLTMALRPMALRRPMALLVLWPDLGHSGGEDALALVDRAHEGHVVDVALVRGRGRVRVGLGVG